jgi:hemerythrin
MYLKEVNIVGVADWSSELETGVAKVDMQHKELVKKVNELHDQLESGNNNRQAIEGMVNYLGRYVTEHFQTEEKLMTSCNYPGYPAHKKIHEDFVNDFGKLAQEFKTSTDMPLLTFLVKRSIVGWLVNHILKVDKEMAKFVKANGKAA